LAILAAIRRAQNIYSVIIGFVGAALVLFVDKFDPDVMMAKSLKFKIAAIRSCFVLALGGWRRLLQFLPFDFAEPGIQRLACAHQTRPRPDADELHAGSFIRVYQVTVVFVADVSPNIIQDRFHDRQSN
jgi:hypothetical protein